MDEEIILLLKEIKIGIAVIVVMLVLLGIMIFIVATKKTK
jgi:hypothetical protein